MHVELHQTDDNQILLVLQGEGHGELYFRDLTAFAAFIEKCYDSVERYEACAESYANLVGIETPIPKPFVDAFDDNEKP